MQFFDIFHDFEETLMIEFNGFGRIAVAKTIKVIP